MSDIKKKLLLFFDRPTEPCFMQKGSDNTVFELPEHYYPEKYKGAISTTEKKLDTADGRTLPLKDIPLPDLSLPLELPYRDPFSLFIPQHRAMAGKLIDIFMGMPDVEDLISICSYCQMRINPHMFNYCLSVTLLHRPDTKGLQIPTFVESFPDKFMDPQIFRKAREIANTVPPENRMPLIIPQYHTASAKEPEHRVAYFREDIGINLHHWHWHLVYPSETMDKSLVDKDRRGELLYYMHHQILARYNVERMCNELSRVKSFSDLRGPITEGYFPKLDSQVACRAWPPRFANVTLQDVDRPADKLNVTINQLETWYDRLREAVNSGTVVLPNNETMPLDQETGIDVLGNLVEAATVISKNPKYYGDLHNMGHNVFGFIHDPDHRHLENFGVMGDTATAMRDPIFYRWHAFLDDLFITHKDKLAPYSADQLVFPGIRCSGISVEGKAGANTIKTQWEQSTVELGRGLDFTPRGSVLARFTHLQHDEFNHVIEVDNTTGCSVVGMFRIFIAPIADENGKLFSFDEQRHLMIELDKFAQALYRGKNTIRRSSVESSVTIPYERTFRRQQDRPGDLNSKEAAAFDFCGCGWPHHMLLPKGTLNGYPMMLFVMVSNWKEDHIDQELVGSCNDAASYCGIRDRRYPDRKAMGYPFDRRARSGVNSLTDFLTPNMAATQCSIKFTDATRLREQ